MQIVSLGDNLHEISKLISGQNKKKIYVVCWKRFSAEFTKSMVKAELIDTIFSF